LASYSFVGYPEVFSTTADQSEIVAAGMREGKIRRLRRGLYTKNLSDDIEKIVARNFWQIVAALCPDTVISHRAAFQGGRIGNLVVVTGPYDRKIEDLPGLRIRQIKGPGPLPGDAPFIGKLFMSSRGRFLMEVLSGKVYGKESPFLSGEEVETFLAGLSLLGEDSLNEVRDQARSIKGAMGMASEFARLDAIVGALMGTRKTALTSKTARARVAGDPYDANRLELFQRLFEELKAWPAASRPDTDLSAGAFRNIGFFDAYFSNFIEGTEFLVEEAMEIAFENKIPAARPEDAHDILGTFRIVSNQSEMSTRISGLSAEDFLSLMQSWHATIMSLRPDKRPGRFKETANRAGQTIFVEPSLVRGTLKTGFEMGRTLHSAFARSAFLMFLIAEVHPFDDGNGRVTRAVANAELVSGGERRILVPTVFRVEYVDALRQLSREGMARTFCRMLDQAQEFSFDIDFRDFTTARARLEQWHAFDTNSESRLRPPR
jgi:hypothetical protein